MWSVGNRHENKQAANFESNDAQCTTSKALLQSTVILIQVHLIMSSHTIVNYVDLSTYAALWVVVATTILTRTMHYGHVNILSTVLTCNEPHVHIIYTWSLIAAQAELAELICRPPRS